VLIGLKFTYRHKHSPVSDYLKRITGREEKNYMISKERRVTDATISLNFLFILDTALQKSF